MQCSIGSHVGRVEEDVGEVGTKKAEIHKAPLGSRLKTEEEAAASQVSHTTIVTIHKILQNYNQLSFYFNFFLIYMVYWAGCQANSCFLDAIGV